MLLNNSSRSCGTLESLRENFTRRCSSVPPAYPPTSAMIMSVQTAIQLTYSARLSLTTRLAETLTASTTFLSKAVFSAQSAAKSSSKQVLIIRNLAPGFSARSAENDPTCPAPYIAAETVVTYSQLETPDSSMSMRTE